MTSGNPPLPMLKFYFYQMSVWQPPDSRVSCYWHREASSIRGGLFTTFKADFLLHLRQTFYKLVGYVQLTSVAKGMWVICG